MESKTSPTSSQKKLKQSRLPFQIISVTRKDEGIDGRKRRLSESNDDPARATKVGKIDETKENVKSDQPVETTVIVLDDNDDDDLAPGETSVVSIASESPKTKTNKPDTGKLPKNCDKSEKIQKTVKKRKLKVVDSEGEPTDNAILKIKLPISSKKRNKSITIEKSSVGSAKTAENPTSELEDEIHCSSKVEITEKNFKIAANMDLTPPCNKNKEDKSMINEEVPQNDNSPENTQDSPQATSPNKHATLENQVIENGVVTGSEEKSVTASAETLTTTSGVCKTPVSAGKSKLDTPKQLQRKKELEQRNLERQRAKEERERKIQEEKVQRLEKEMQKKREREEKEEQKRKEREEREEQKRKEKKEREEKEEQKRLEREEKERKRLAEVEQKNEERKQKEEEKRKKELEAELKKKRASEAFTKFFVAKKADQRNTFEDDSSSGDVNIPEGQLAFMPFQKKENMRIAPSIRRCLSEKSKFELEAAITAANVNKDELYIQLVRNGLVQTRKSERTWQNDDDDVVIVISECSHFVYFVCTS
jgi:chromatin assembly factor 1 subunit A